MSNITTWPQATHTLRLIEQQFPTPDHIKQLHDGLLTDLVKGIMAGTLPSREEIQKCYGIYGGTTHLKLISAKETLILDPTDGNETMAQAEDVFQDGIDINFIHYGCEVKSEQTGEQEVVVHELIKDAHFQTIFDSLAGNLDKLCLTQPQIIHFVRNYPNWLCQFGQATFFLFKVGDEFFVAKVRVRDVRIRMHLSRFKTDEYIWECKLGHRVVSPQLLK